MTNYEPEHFIEPVKGERITKETCIEELIKVAEDYPDITITRDFFRSHSFIKDRDWGYWFGKFSEFMKASGLKTNRYEEKINNKIAQHASVDILKNLTQVTKSYGNRYQRDPGKGNYRTVMVISDLHDEKMCPFTERVWYSSLKMVQPDVVVFGGDLFDNPEFSKFDVDPREWNVVSKIKRGLEIVANTREILPDAQIDLISGNHECISHDTLVLCINGWKLASTISLSDKIASIDLQNNNTLSYDEPLALGQHEDQLYKITGDLHDEVVSSNHNLIIDGKRIPIKEIKEEKINQTRFSYSFQGNNSGIELDSNWLRLLIWTIMDGTIIRRKLINGEESNNKKIQFKLSKIDKINNLKNLLDTMEIKYTFRKAVMSGYNILQPYYITIYGDTAREIDELLHKNKSIPVSWKGLNKEQIKIFLDTIVKTDGSHTFNHTIWTTTDYKNAEIIQYACLTNNIACKIEPRINNGEFSKKIQYIVSIFNNGVSNRQYVNIEPMGMGKVISIQTKNSTLVTMRNGKPVITGNCRILKHLAHSSPAMRALLSDFHDMDMAKLFKLDLYEVNFISNIDLATFTKREEQGQIQKNYKIYYDSFLVHHFPQGKNLGIPGCNGHHHKYISTPQYNSTYGNYEWIQLGCGHKKNADYANADFWSNGFVIVNINIDKQRVCFDYTDVGQYHSVSGGSWYYREPHEFYPAINGT